MANQFVIKDLNSLVTHADPQGSTCGYTTPPETSLNAQQGADSADYIYTILVLMVSQNRFNIAQGKKSIIDHAFSRQYTQYRAQAYTRWNMVLAQCKLGKY